VLELRGHIALKEMPKEIRARFEKVSAPTVAQCAQIRLTSFSAIPPIERPEIIWCVEPNLSVLRGPGQ
jgi:hypothetical protein